MCSRWQPPLDVPRYEKKSLDRGHFICGGGRPHRRGPTWTTRTPAFPAPRGRSFSFRNTCSQELGSKSCRSSCPAALAARESAVVPRLVGRPGTPHTCSVSFCHRQAPSSLLVQRFERSTNNKRACPVSRNARRGVAQLARARHGQGMAAVRSAGRRKPAIRSGHRHLRHRARRSSGPIIKSFCFCS